MIYDHSSFNSIAQNEYHQEDGQDARHIIDVVLRCFRVRNALVIAAGAAALAVVQYAAGVITGAVTTG